MDADLIALEIVTAFSDHGVPYGAPYIAYLERKELIKILRTISAKGYKFEWIDLAMSGPDRGRLIVGQVNTELEKSIYQEMEEAIVDTLDRVSAAARVLYRRFPR